ncbi:MAG: YciI family protein [Pseudomonadota bacterium]
MPSWNEYKTMAQARGALAMELYVVQSRPGGAPEAVKGNLPDHLDYQARMEAAGHLVMAGPVSDQTGELMEGAGMIVYRAESLEAARALAEADPMHLSGARTFEIRRWLVNEGRLTLDVALSSQSVRVT